MKESAKPNHTIFMFAVNAGKLCEVVLIQKELLRNIVGTETPEELQLTFPVMRMGHSIHREKSCIYSSNTEFVLGLGFLFCCIFLEKNKPQPCCFEHKFPLGHLGKGSFTSRQVIKPPASNSNTIPG